MAASAAAAHDTISSSSSSSISSSSCICCCFVFLLLVLSSPAAASPTPFILVHGFGDYCGSPWGSHLLHLFTKYSGAPGFCVEIGNGLWDSCFMSMEQQAAELCQKVKGMKELKNGFNAVALSQGNLLVRSVIEFCDGAPPVKNYISLAGPHAGTAALPGCGILPTFLCKFMNSVIKYVVYSDFSQDHLSASGYLKLPNAIPEYVEKCRFLPKLNNEIPGKRNSTYKERFSTLNNLVLIMFEPDGVIVPKQSAWFGFYLDESLTTILPPQQTQLYKEDWIGLRALDEAGKVQFVSVKGVHLFISDEDANKYVIPYLKDDDDEDQTTTTSEISTTDHEITKTSTSTNTSTDQYYSSFIRSEEGSVAAI